MHHFRPSACLVRNIGLRLYCITNNISTYFASLMLFQYTPQQKCPYTHFPISKYDLKKEEEHRKISYTNIFLSFYFIIFSFYFGNLPILAKNWKHINCHIDSDFNLSQKNWIFYTNNFTEKYLRDQKRLFDGKKNKERVKHPAKKQLDIVHILVPIYDLKIKNKKAICRLPK